MQGAIPVSALGGMESKRCPAPAPVAAGARHGCTGCLEQRVLSKNTFGEGYEDMCVSSWEDEIFDTV